MKRKIPFIILILFIIFAISIGIQTLYGAWKPFAVFYPKGVKGKDLNVRNEDINLTKGTVVGKVEMFNTVKVFDKNGDEEVYTWDGDKYFEAAQKLQAFTKTFKIVEEESMEPPRKNCIAFLMMNRVIIVLLDKQSPENEVFVTRKDDTGYQIEKGSKEKLEELFSWLKQNGVQF